MKIGLSSATFFGKSLTENSFDLMQSMGVNIGEVFLTTFTEYQESFTDLLADRQGDFEVYSVHSLNNHYEPELFNRVERTRSDGEELFDKVVKGAHKLNAKYYTFHGPSRLKITEYKLDYGKIGTRVEELCQRASQHSIKLSYENVSWAFYNSPGFFQKLREYSHSITACLDIKQAMQAYRYMTSYNGKELKGTALKELEDYTYEYISDMGEHLVNVHLADYDEYGKLCPPGKGIFNFKKFINKLEETSYSGPMMIELYSGDYESYDEVKQSVDYLKQLIMEE